MCACVNLPNLYLDTQMSVLQVYPLQVNDIVQRKELSISVTAGFARKRFVSISYSLLKKINK